MSEFKPGDRVYVTDLRAIMSRATGEEKPNHHVTVEEVWDDGDVLIYFDDGVGAPYPVAEVRRLTASTTGSGPMTTPTVGPFVGHYHDRVYCGVCSICQRELILMASHAGDERFILALCETCDAPTVARIWGES